MERRDHHDWASDVYVNAWVTRQLEADAARAAQFQLICDLFPFPLDTRVTILDVGSGYGPVSQYIFDRYPQATCIGQDGSAPMLQHAKQRLGNYGSRFVPWQSDLFDPGWVPPEGRPFDAVVSVSCLHNLRDFERIRTIYHDIYTHLKPGGVFLNLDLVNAPTPQLQQHYDRVAAMQQQRAAGAHPVIAADEGTDGHTPAPSRRYAFPGNLIEHLAALKRAGFVEVDCFWKDLRRALYGGYK